MPAAQMQYYNFVAATVNVPTTTETVIATTRAVSSTFPGSSFAIIFAVDFLTGASVTGVSFRVRQQTIAGSVVFSSLAIAAAASTQLPRMYVATVDAPAGEVTSFPYVLTVQQIAATGNGTSSNAFAQVTVAE